MEKVKDPTERAEARKKQFESFGDNRESLFWRVTMLPMLAMTLGIIFLGLGVWYLRRR
jgi:uncharacterized protein with GYD domain